MPLLSAAVFRVRGGLSVNRWQTVPSMVDFCRSLFQIAKHDQIFFLSTLTNYPVLKKSLCKQASWEGKAVRDVGRQGSPFPHSHLKNTKLCFEIPREFISLMLRSYIEKSRNAWAEVKIF